MALGRPLTAARYLAASLGVVLSGSLAACSSASTGSQPDQPSLTSTRTEISQASIPTATPYGWYCEISTVLRFDDRPPRYLRVAEFITEDPASRDVREGYCIAIYSESDNLDVATMRLMDGRVIPAEWPGSWFDLRREPGPTYRFAASRGLTYTGNPTGDNDPGDAVQICHFPDYPSLENISVATLVACSFDEPPRHYGWIS